MGNYNRIILVVNLVRGPEIRYVRSESPVQVGARADSISKHTAVGVFVALSSISTCVAETPFTRTTSVSGPAPWASDRGLTNFVYPLRMASITVATVV